MPPSAGTDPMNFFTWPLAYRAPISGYPPGLIFLLSSNPTPPWFAITVRSFAPCRDRAVIRFIGSPPNDPNPPIMITAPSNMSATALSQSEYTLFTAILSSSRETSSRNTGRQYRAKKSGK